MPQKHHIIIGAIVLLLMLAAYHSAAAGYLFAPAIEQRELDTHQYLDIQNTGARIVAVGERGLIVYSEDKGSTWQQATVPVSLTLTAVHFPTPDRGWAVGHGGVIVNSADGGKSWQLQYDGNDVNQAWLEHSKNEAERLRKKLAAQDPAAISTEQLRALQLQLEDAEYAVEDAQVALENGPNDPFLDVFFVDENNGWAVGAYGMLYTTNNGGTQWRYGAAQLSNRDRYHLYSLAATADGVLFTGGELGILYRSVDNGVSWESLTSPYDGSLFGLTIVNGNHVLCYGLRGNMYLSKDTGNSWQALASENAASLFADLALPDGNLLLAGATGALLASTDNGASFHVNYHNSRYSFTALAATSDGNVLLASINGLLKIPYSSLITHD